ncbi:chromophore lyase CpcT/CpeT [bacterium]|nr:chromophore lyase CpcT/CpeT [candidate division CSSED10-310 bacterium]
MKINRICLAILVIMVPAASGLAQDLDIEFAMPSTMVLPGSSFSLDLTIDNTGPAMPDAVLFVALTIGTGDYWFYPSWVQYPPDYDSAHIDIAADSTDTWRVMQEFAWPAGVGEFSGAMFLGAVVHHNELVSNVAQIKFGWTEMPKTYQTISTNSDWVAGSITNVSKSTGFCFNGTAGSTYHIWWDDVSSGSGTCTADVRVSAFHEDKTTAYFRDADNGYNEPGNVIIAPGETSVYVVLTSENHSPGSFRIGVTFFPYSPDKSVNARQATAWMTGDFDSYNQSQQHPAYYNITLRMKWIWPARTDGYWLYVEQAMAGSPPYRQRVYQIRMASGTEVASEVYEFINAADEQNAVGAWADENPLSDLSPVDFELREDCTVFLTREDLDTFMGGTEGKDCASDLNGATYATSEVTLTADQMRSWDRGYNSNDQQVWGAVAGPYIFDKHENFDSGLDL